MKKTADMEAQAIALRKKILIAEGALYRSSCAGAVEQVKGAVQPAILAKAGASVAGKAALGLLGARAPMLAMALQKMWPVLAKGAAVLSAKTADKPLLRGVLITSAVAACARLLFRRK